MNALTGIAVGGALGSVLRHVLGTSLQRLVPVGFPVGTLAVNIAGCAVAGALAKLFMNAQAYPDLRSALVVGFCGGFTTFSAFSLEAVALAQAGAVGKAAGYVALSMILCLLAAAAGFAAARSL